MNIIVRYAVLENNCHPEIHCSDSSAFAHFAESLFHDPNNTFRLYFRYVFSISSTEPSDHEQPLPMAEGFFTALIYPILATSIEMASRRRVMGLGISPLDNLLFSMVGRDWRGGKQSS